MSQDTPTNGRVDSAVLNTKLDHLTTVVLQTNARVEDIRIELGGMRKDLAVNEERWRNHDRAQKKHADGHEKLHQRERGILGTLILVVGGVSTSLSAGGPIGEGMRWETIAIRSRRLNYCLIYSEIRACLGGLCALRAEPL